MIPEQLITREFAMRELVIFVLVVVGCLFLGTVLSTSLAPILGIEGFPELLENISDDTPRETLQSVQVILAISQLFTFLIPGLIFAFFYDKFKWLTKTTIQIELTEPIDNQINKKDWKERIFLHRLPSAENLVWGFGLLMLTFIAMQLVYWLNKQIPLPEALRAAEDSSQALIQAMMQLDSPYGLITNLFVMALLPAVGEELIFRGLLQRIMVRLTANVHAGIWISATLFSLMHWQFEGFFVRQLLGALFGYLLYWSGSLWLPIIVHFVFNGLQIVAQYLYFQGKIDIDIDQEIEMTTSQLTMGGVALVIALFLCYYLHQKRKQERTYYEQEMGENL